MLPPLPPEEENRAQIPASCIASVNGPSSATRCRRDFPVVHLLIKLLICFGKSCVCEGLGKTLLGDGSISPLYQRDEVCAPIDVCSGYTLLRHLASPCLLSSWCSFHLLLPASYPMPWNTSELASKDSAEISSSITGSFPQAVLYGMFFPLIGIPKGLWRPLPHLFLTIRS